MTLVEYMRRQGIDDAAMAKLIGNCSVSRLRKWKSGERAARAEIIERIEAVTDGAVTAQDMHETRLAWRRRHDAPGEAPDDNATDPSHGGNPSRDHTRTHGNLSGNAFPETAS